MRVIANLITELGSVPNKTVEAEKLGYDAAYSAEINNDPFLPLALAAEHSNSIELMTSIAVAFARNPMTLANTAHDLNEFSQGRFVLGIGSQIKPHITRRLSMPWSRPAARMREFILAMRAIWDCWHQGTSLDFNGEFYTHNLMTPMFVPASRDFAAPKVRLAAVGPLMTEVAAEVADGMIAHGFTTAEYLRQVTWPAIDKGLAKSGRARSEFDVCCPIVVVSGVDEQQFEANLAAVKMQLAFYASTPAYKPVLELHGWEGLQEEAHRMSRNGHWQAMAELIEPDILNEFALVAETPGRIAALMHERYSGLVDSWECTFDSGDAALQQQLIKNIQGIS